MVSEEEWSKNSKTTQKTLRKSLDSLRPEALIERFV